MSDLKEFIEEYDAARDCGWNYMNFVIRDRVDIYDQAVRDAVMATARPCKACGNDELFFSDYEVGCCGHLGDRDGCEADPDCECGSYASNMNLQDAVTRWNLDFGLEGRNSEVAA